MLRLHSGLCITRNLMAGRYFSGRLVGVCGGSVDLVEYGEREGGRGRVGYGAACLDLMM